MRYLSLVMFSAILVAVSVAPCSADIQDQGQWIQSFHELRDLRWLAIDSDFQTRQFSSYDRTGGNNDAGYCLKEEGSSRLLFDEKGPGEIVRIWSANPHASLIITLDGSKVYYHGPFEKLFDNSTHPFLAPLSTTSSGGNISYFPIPYAESAKVEMLDGSNLYYHITYRSYNHPVDSAGDFDPATRSAFNSAQQVWANPGPVSAAQGDPDPILPGKSMTKSVKDSFRLAAGKTRLITRLIGSGYIGEIKFLLPAPQISALRQVRLAIKWDGASRPGVDVPLLDLFGSSFGLKDFKSLAIGRAGNGWHYLRLPMPFKKSAEVFVISQSRSPIYLHCAISWHKGRISKNALYYRTSFHAARTEEGKPHNILRAEGAGQFVGMTLSVQGSKNVWYLEGDEQISVDGRPISEFHGTGTEDYFNSGWYFRDGTVSQPLHGCLERDVINSRISAYRFHLTDRIPFKKSINFDIEHGGTNDSPGARYSSVAHWYSASPGDAFTPTVQAANLEVSRIPMRLPPHAVSFAGLLLTERSGGSVTNCDWSGVSPAVEGAPVAVFRPKRLGNAVAYQLPIAYPDTYRLVLWAGKGPGLGRVRVDVDGRMLGEYDLWSAQANHPERIDIGTVEMSKGIHNVRFQVIGRNRSSGGMSLILGHLELNSDGRFVTGWKILGPFDGRDREGLDKAHINETAVPAMSESHNGAGGTVSWKDATVNNGVVVFTDRQHTVWYAAVAVNSPEDLSTELLTGSDDSMKVWLNGQLVHDIHTSRNTIPDSDHIKVNLKKGRNVLLVKVLNIAGPCNFCARFRDHGNRLSYESL